MNANDRINKAKTALIIRHPFFGNFAAMLNYKEKDPEFWYPNAPTMATDGNNIYWCKEFVDEITDQQLLGVIIHEIYHCIYMHTDKMRVAGRDSRVWGLAIDFVTNVELKDDVKQELPPGGLYDRDLVRPSDKPEGRTAEQVYSIIMNDIKTNPNSAYGKMIPQDLHMVLKALPEDIKEKILISYEAAKASSHGSTPAGIERLVKDIKKSKVKWERLFHRYIGSMISRDDYTFSRPNRRFIASEIYLPSLYNEKIGDIIFICDTSGSMGKEDLSQILGELTKISPMVEKITVISCDADVHEVIQTYTIGDIINKVKFTGGGGTNFRPAFEKIHEMNVMPELVIFATDTFGSFPEEKPPYPVVWVSTVSKESASEIPFGHVIYME
jgi:predicted metal-dependent peptidase